MHRTIQSARGVSGRLAAVVLIIAGAVAVIPATAGALTDPGTPRKDVHVGRDDDNATNPLIQPTGVQAPPELNVPKLGRHSASSNPMPDSPATISPR